MRKQNKTRDVNFLSREQKISNIKHRSPNADNGKKWLKAS